MHLLKATTLPLIRILRIFVVYRFLPAKWIVSSGHLRVA